MRAGGLWRNGTRLADGVELTERSLVRALADQQSRVTEALEAFADNTLRHLRDEGRLLADGIDFPPLTTRFRDRHAVVVARGPGYKSDLQDRAARTSGTSSRCSSRSTVERTRCSRSASSRT